MNIAITGFSGSGKSTFSRMLSEKIGAAICEVDVLFRESFLEQKKSMISLLGEDCINSDGTINFGLLSLLTPEKDYAIRQQLSESMNKKILEEEENAKNENKHIIFDYLFLTDCNALVNADVVIRVEAPIETRYNRMLDRGNGRFKFTKEQFLAMDKLVETTLWQPVE